MPHNRAAARVGCQMAVVSGSGIDGGGPPVTGVETGMTVRENERALEEELAVFPDPHERLAHLVRRAGRRTPVPEDSQTDESRVHGCVSRVWLTGRVVDGRCRFQAAADSPMVLGLVGLLCDVYDGAAPADVMSHESDILARVGLDRQISPTRLHGLSQVRARMRSLAAAMVS